MIGFAAGGQLAVFQHAGDHVARVFVVMVGLDEIDVGVVEEASETTGRSAPSMTKCLGSRLLT